MAEVKVSKEQFEQKLRQATVGIAGLGGLGSTVAVALARAGVGRLIIADFDKVEQSNLNRQHYFVEQIGRDKVAALSENIKKINPAVGVIGHKVRLTAENVPVIFKDAQVVAECFDKAAEKQVLVETVLKEFADKMVVSASGLAGYGRSNAIKTKRSLPRLIVVGDQETSIEYEPVLTAARVWIAASHQANAILELIVDGAKR